MAVTVWLWANLLPGSSLPHKAWPLLGQGALLALSFAVLERAQAHVEVRKHTYTVNLSEAPLVVGMALTPPLVVLVARLVAFPFIQGKPWRRPVKSFFNATLTTAESAVALTVLRELNGDHLTAPHTWPTAYAAIFAANAASVLWITLAITITQGRPPKREFVSMLVPFLVSSTLTTSLGLLAVLAIRAQPASGVVLAVVGLLILLAYRAYAALASRHATLGELHRFAQKVVAAQGAAELVQVLLRDATRLLSADSAVVWQRDPAPALPSGLRLRTHGGSREQWEAVTGWPDDPLRRHVADSGKSVVLPRGDSSPWLAREGVRDLVLVPLPGGDGSAGLLEIRDRLGEMSSFSPEDARLAEALAAHVAVALENNRLIERSVYDATHDALTSLPNRDLFASRLGEALDAGPAAVLIVDLDRFGEVNDTLGADSGDEVLRQVGGRLREAGEALGAEVTVARVGNDEFALLLPGVAQVETALRRAHDVRQVLLRPVTVADLSLDASGAIGVAVAPMHGTDAQLLLRRAEAALRLAKDSEPAVQAWRAALDTADPRRLALVGELRRALERDELVLHFQPKVALTGERAGEVVGVEALVRWQHPVEGLLSSDEFLPMAERTGLVVPLTAVVLRLALQQCRRWRDAGREIPVAVNLSVRGLLDPHLPGTVGQLLSTYQLPSRMLTLEITESSVMQDVPRALPVLQRLAEQGIALSVDDFGTGYSSLAYLRRLPVQEVKIDKSFVLDMAVDPSDAAIVETILGLSRHLGLRAVAEGVEDERTWDRLTSMGCDVGQGYLFSRPVPAERLFMWLTMRDVPVLRRQVRLVR